jgi:ZIP family zinc transporter
MAGSLGLAAGVMLTVSVFDLWLPVCYDYGWTPGNLSLAAGAVAFLVIEVVVDKIGLGEPKMLPTQATEDEDGKSKVGDTEKQRKMRLGMLMMVSLTIHNFPEGLAVVVSALSSQKLGIIMCVAIGLHNIPEGLTIAVPIYAATGDRRHAFLMASASGLSEPLGALTALLFLRPYMLQNPNIVGYAMCAVGGIMSAVSFKELIPEGLKYDRPAHFWGGFVLGVAVMALTLYFDV